MAALGLMTSVCLWTFSPLQLLPLVASNDRVLRNLVYVNEGVFKFKVGLTVPVDVPGRSVVSYFNFQGQYTLPDNATYFTSPFASRSLVNTEEVPEANITEESTATDDEETIHRASTATDDEDTIHRGVIYGAVESALSRKGVDGRACVLRSICEASETPLHHDGLIGELLHTLLTPDYGSSKVDLIEEDYLQAQEAGGREDVDCSSLYPECPPGFGLLDWFTVVKDS